MLLMLLGSFRINWEECCILLEYLHNIHRLSVEVDNKNAAIFQLQMSCNFFKRCEHWSNISQGWDYVSWIADFIL